MTLDDDYDAADFFLSYSQKVDADNEFMFYLELMQFVAKMNNELRCHECKKWLNKGNGEF